MKKNIIIKTFLTLFLTTQYSFANLSLEDAINSALENNYELRSQEYSYKAAKSEKLKSIGGFLPTAQINVDQGSRKTKIGNDQRVNDDVDKKSFTASQNIFNGFGDVSEVKKANSIIKKEKAIKDAKTQEISLNVIKSYLDILKYKKLIEIGANNLNSQKRLLGYIRRKLKAKDATKSEIAKAEADYIKAKNDQLTNKNNLNLVKNNFSLYTGLSMSDIVILKEIEENKIAKSKENANNQAIDELLNLALQANPDVRMAKHGFVAAKHHSNVSKSALSPKVTLNFDIREEQNSIYLNNREERDTRLYLNVNVPLFNSGRNYFDIASTNNNKQKEKYNYEATKRNIHNSIIEYVNKQNNYQANYQSAKELERANKIYLKTLKQEEKFGTKSIIELLEAKQNLYNSQIEVINLYYEKLYNQFEIDALIGKLVR